MSSFNPAHVQQTKIIAAAAEMRNQNHQLAAAAAGLAPITP